jgi:hypothetical protein
MCCCRWGPLTQPAEGTGRRSGSGRREGKQAAARRARAVPKRTLRCGSSAEEAGPWRHLAVDAGEGNGRIDAVVTTCTPATEAGGAAALATKLFGCVRQGAPDAPPAKASNGGSAPRQRRAETGRAAAASAMQGEREGFARLQADAREVMRRPAAAEVCGSQRLRVAAGRMSIEGCEGVAPSISSLCALRVLGGALHANAPG